MIVSCNLVSDVGCVRTNNEDIVLLDGEFYRDNAFRSTFTLTDQARMAAVIADGMGGHAGGEFASELAAQSFQDFVETLPDMADTVMLHDMMKSWATDAHFMIKSKGNEMPQYKDMGTTFVGLLFYAGTVNWINIGDSRLYRYRGGVLRQLSTDHSLRERENDPTIPSNIIYNALGVGDSVFADVADISSRILPGDKYIICSDGLSDMVDDDCIEKIMNENGDAQQLVDAAKDAGGKDNVSVLVVGIDEV